MKKSKWLDMDYKPLECGEVDTLYKCFDNGNMWIVQFNEDVKEDEVGKVYLTKEQVEELFK